MKLYHLYGLAVASDFECPELTEITPKQAVARNYETVYLDRADAPLTLPEGRQYASWMRATRDACLYQIPDTARMLMERPDRISVEMLPDGVENDMRAYLFGIGFATLVHMRGLIPLHVSAIRTPDGVVAFTGPSGAGKSTKVAELHFKHGWPIICDDVAVMHPTDESPLLHAGMNRIKLWKDAVERFGIDPQRLIRDMAREDKFHLSSPEMFTDKPMPLRTLLDLSRRHYSEKETSGGTKFNLLLNSIHLPEIVTIFSNRSTLFENTAQIANQI